MASQRFKLTATTALFVGLAVLVLGGVGLAWLWSHTDDSTEPPAPMAEVPENGVARLQAPGADPEDPDPEAAPVVERQGLAEEGPAQGTRPGFEAGYRGRLAWRDTGMPLAGVELKLTVDWENSVLPLPTGDGAAQEQDDLIENTRMVTNRHGYFALPPVPFEGELFLWIDPGGEAEDLFKLTHAEWRDQIVDLGTILVDPRGELLGRVTLGGQPVTGVRVRAFDLPLDDFVGDDDRRATMLRGAVELDREGIWVDEDGIGELPRWVIDRDTDLPFPEAVTDEQGRFRIRGIRPGQVLLVAHGPRATEETRDVVVRARQTTDVGDVEFDVRPYRGVTLEFENADATPAIGIDVTVLSLTERKSMLAMIPEPARTDHLGRVEVGDLGADVQWALVRRGPRWPWEFYQLVDLHKLRRNQVLQVKLDELRTGRIQTVDRFGTPVMASLRLFSATTSFGARPELMPALLQPRAIADGLWEYELPPARYRIAAFAPGWLPATLLFQPPELMERPFPVPMAESFTLTVSVVDDEGLPVRGARVFMRSVDAEARTDERWRRLTKDGVMIGVTDAEGLVTREDFYGKRISLAAEHPDFVRSPAEIADLMPDSVVVVQLQRGAGVQGVVRERGLVPAERWLVVARPSRSLLMRYAGNELLVPHEVSMGADGSYSIRGLLEGKWWLDLVPPGTEDDDEELTPQQRIRAAARPEGQEVWLYAGTVVKQDLELRPAPTTDPDLFGTVKLDGGPVRGIIVRASVVETSKELEQLGRIVEDLRAALEKSRPGPRHDRMKQALAYYEEMDRARSWTESTTTDIGGSFHFTKVRSGSGLVEVVRVDQRATQILWSTKLELPAPDRSLEVDLSLGTVQLSLRDRDGYLVSRKQVRLEQEDGGGRFVAVSGEAGQVEVIGVPAGVYRVRIGDSPKSAETASFDVVAGRANSYSLQLN